jgi:hypothetical protein
MKQRSRLRWPAFKNSETRQIFCVCLFPYRLAITHFRLMLKAWVSPFGQMSFTFFDRLCGPMVRVPGYRSRGPGSIPGATRFFDK